MNIGHFVGSVDHSRFYCLRTTRSDELHVNIHKFSLTGTLYKFVNRIRAEQRIRCQLYEAKVSITFWKNTNHQGFIS